MRNLLLLVTTTAAMAVPTSEVAVDPKILVLREVDLPGWRLDVDNSGPRSNRSEAEGDPELSPLFARTGRLRGYEANYDRGSAAISSRADVFRGQNGAHVFLDWFVRRASPPPYRRGRADVGAEGWVVHSPAFTIIVWRRGPVFAGIATLGVSRKRAISLARVQDRRIAAVRR